MPSDLEAVFEAGLQRLGDGDNDAAIDSFSFVIDSPDADPLLRSCALNYRGQAWLRAGDPASARKDWEKVLATEALGDDDYHAAKLGLAQLPPEDESRGSNLFLLGVARLNQEDFFGAISAFTGVLRASDADEPLMMKALNHRGFAYLRIGEIAMAVNDWSAVAQSDSAPEDEVRAARAAMERVDAGERLRQSSEMRQAGDSESAIQEYYAILKSPGDNKFDQIAAAEALVRIQDTPDWMRQEAEAILSRMFQSSATLGASASLEEQKGAVSSIPGKLLLWILAGAISMALFFSPFGVVFAILGKELSPLYMLPFIGAIIGSLLGVGQAFIEWFNDR